MSSKRALLVAIYRLYEHSQFSMAGAVAFFASEESSFITGNVLVIDGGMTVKAL